MVVEYEGGAEDELDVVDVVDGGGGELVVGGVVEVVPTVIWACATGTQDSNTQPTIGHQISCERRELIVMGAVGHPGTGPMVGWAKFRTGLFG
jgi:hypothetical protein